MVTYIWANFLSKSLRIVPEGYAVCLFLGGGGLIKKKLYYTYNASTNLFTATIHRTPTKYTFLYSVACVVDAVKKWIERIR